MGDYFEKKGKDSSRNGNEPSSKLKVKVGGFIMILHEVDDLVDDFVGMRRIL